MVNYWTGTMTRLFPTPVSFLVAYVNACTCLHNCLCGMGIAGVMTSRCIDKTVHLVSEGGVTDLGVSLSHLEPCEVSRIA